MNHLVTIIKNDGTNQLFEEEKLVNSLKRAGATAQAIDQVIEEIEHKMHNGMSTTDIYTEAFSALKKHSAVSAVKYSIRRALLEFGPDGFPFEKFVARIFRIWGYETLTDQTVLGGCVPHEIDVVAWKGMDLAMVEAKFHNVFQMSSDVKVALYVKARFDDIGETLYDYGGTPRKLSERWLVTNTKFTDRAIHYSECQKIKMLGWNYPVKGNLHDIIEEYGLQPITSLSSATNMQKRELIAKGTLACIDLIGKPDLLSEVGIRGESAERILTEAQLIVQEAK